MRETQSRVDCIDILRGAAALAVALFHFNEPLPPRDDAYHAALKWGWLGVPVFFVVSGYCVAAARAKSDFGVFCRRRLLRIFPPYWASVGLVLGVVALRLATSGTNDVTPLPKDLVAVLHTALALVQPATSTPGIKWVYWSLGYELAFYLVLGALGGRGAALLLPLFSALAIFAPGFPFDHWGLFGLGVAGSLALHGNRAHSLPLAALCLAGCLHQLGVEQTAAGVLTSLVIAFPPGFASRAILRPLRAVGAWSYSLYLVHVPIGCYLVPHYLPWSFDRNLGASLLQDALLIACSVATAVVFYRLIERLRHGHDPEAYIRDLLTRLPAMSSKQELDALTPSRWRAPVAATTLAA